MQLGAATIDRTDHLSLYDLGERGFTSLVVAFTNCFMFVRSSIVMWTFMLTTVWQRFDTETDIDRRSILT